MVLHQTVEKLTGNSVKNHQIAENMYIQRSAFEIWKSQSWNSWMSNVVMTFKSLMSNCLHLLESAKLLINSSQLSQWLQSIQEVLCFSSDWVQNSHKTYTCIFCVFLWIPFIFMLLWNYLYLSGLIFEQITQITFSCGNKDINSHCCIFLLG